jgi:hypothetical protein
MQIRKNEECREKKKEIYDNKNGATERSRKLYIVKIRKN